MLLLARKLKETIMIGDDIEIELVLIDHDRAVIGIRAPRNIPVHRAEIYQRNQVMLKKLNQVSFQANK